MTPNRLKSEFCLKLKIKIWRKLSPRTNSNCKFRSRTDHETNSEQQWKEQEAISDQNEEEGRSRLELKPDWRHQSDSGAELDLKQTVCKHSEFTISAEHCVLHLDPISNTKIQY